MVSVWISKGTSSGIRILLKYSCDNNFEVKMSVSLEINDFFPCFIAVFRSRKTFKMGILISWDLILPIGGEIHI